MGCQHKDGVLLVDKPAGPTSHDVVARLRSAWAVRPIGHAGTLDPAASGLLVLLMGKWTRSFASFSGMDKAYSGVIGLGAATDTGDAQGAVLRSAEVPPLDPARVREALKSLEGERQQRPHPFSAVKVEGKPAYWYARRGLPVATAARKIRVGRFELVSLEGAAIGFHLDCSSGTYVRVLAEEVGEALSCPAHLASLRRDRIGPFSVDQALPLDQWLSLSFDQAQGRFLPEAAASQAVGPP